MNAERKTQIIEELFNQYYQRLDRYCQRFVGYNHSYDSLVEDCIQEVFFELSNEIELLQNHPAIEGWIMMTCKHRLMTSLDKERRRNKHAAFSIDDSYTDIPDPSPTLIDAWADQEEAKEGIARVLSILNNREQQIVQDYFIDHLPLQDIADKEGTTVSAVKSVIARIRQKLRNLLPILIVLVVLRMLRRS